MVESKGWNWQCVEGTSAHYWKTPSIESYYLLSRWHDAGYKEFLDLGCGLGRHSVLFGKNGFCVHAFDISEDAVESTREWAESEDLRLDYKVGDMLDLPYPDDRFDCIYCKNVISHTDTEGIKKAIGELYRVLKKDGECYLTLGSKDTWGFKQTDWPLIDGNTRMRTDEGPEFGIPHFYADHHLIKELFSGFLIETVYQTVEYFEKNATVFESFHYHVLIKKAR